MNQREERSTAFYDALAPLFDVMTDWGARLAAEGPFLKHILSAAGAVRVLDAGCGSGGHALALARWGYEATGADASPVMIALAQRKAQAAGLHVPLLVSDLAGLPHAFTAESFDAVLCLGNSLPHLLTHEDLVSALRGMAAVMRPGGLLVLQNLNYDLRWRSQPRFFGAQGGTLDGHEVLVWRFADYDTAAGQIAFHVALFRKDYRDWSVEVHTTPQRPLFLAGLASALEGGGFADVQLHGRMALPAEPFDPDRSPDLVVSAHKRAL
jgi:SAM-dependent methyltransferase